jgi:hypothetical protein
MANNIFQLEVLRARKGDCLLLHFGTKSKPGLALVDGGPATVYQNSLRPRLESLRDERGLTEDQVLPIDLMMLSHIDDDHVAGLLDLTKELLDAEPNNDPRIVEIFDLWHNTFDDLISDDAEELTGAVKQVFGPAALNGDLKSAALVELGDAETPAVVDTAMVIASIPQGRELRSNADRLHIERNVEVGGNLIVATKDSAPIDMGKGLTLTVVGPMLPEVKALQAEHRAFLVKHPDIVNKATAALIAEYSDDSKPNLSSIVVLAEVQDKRILFTGDARGDKILEGLELTELVPPGGSIHVDVLKCPHHGSDRNVELDFFQRIIADHYVFSGNGENGNPERTTLELLATARAGDDYVVHLTYPIDEIDKGRKADWDKERKKELTKAEKNPAQDVRPKWSDATNSLTAFLDANPAFKGKVVFVEEDKPHVIDVLS